jgi:hypothetical protein
VWSNETSIDLDDIDDIIENNPLETGRMVVIGLDRNIGERFQ